MKHVWFLQTDNQDIHQLGITKTVLYLMFQFSPNRGCLVLLIFNQILNGDKLAQNYDVSCYLNNRQCENNQVGKSHIDRLLFMWKCDNVSPAKVHFLCSARRFQFCIVFRWSIFSKSTDQHRHHSCQQVAISAVWSGVMVTFHHYHQQPRELALGYALGRGWAEQETEKSG